ncbi:major facilitator superfamily [Chlorella sorokiniana]|uniref:Major facilitator superfamily n=1 Tax=Chlorella sorokiniana TaxID=3076 RepID=A0A2P6TKA2_CHLSO|nr:major facilitator superfamily [Chlorella sorokiniana]|eukprot:PRW44509.1 major facilitator superfamily [Chlorella sorokiniana]
MRVAKAWYLLYFSALSCLFPFLNLFFRRLGYSAKQIGIIGCLRPLVSFPAGSLWSGAADKSRRHRAVLLLTFATSLLLRLSISGVAHRGFGPLLALVVAMEAFAAPVTIIVDAVVMAACTQQADYGKQRLWGAIGWGICSALAGTAISHTGIWAAFAGHAVLAVVAAVPTARLPFGPLHAKLDRQSGRHGCGDSGSDDGSGSGSAAAGAAAGEAAAGSKGAVERFDSATEAQALLSHSKPTAKIGAGTNSSSSGSSGSGSGSSGSSQLEQHGAAEQPPPADQPRVHYWAGVAQLLSNPEAAIFFVQALTMGFGVGNIESYLFLFLDQLGGSETLMGLSLSVTCAAESLVFYFLPAIMAIGIKRCMHLVFLAFLVRMGWYACLAYAPTPWLVLPAEVLHGFTFALAWGGGCAYCAQLAPPGLESTSQGLFQGVYFGAGVGLGSIVGGLVYHRHGAQAVYIVACGVLACGWLLTSLAQLAVALSGRWRHSTDKYLQVAALELADVERNQP